MIEEGRLAAIQWAMEPLRELWKYIKRLIVGSMAEFLDRVDGFIELKEAIRHVNIVGQKKNQQRTMTAGMSLQNP
uniref:Uncharacterized protein n=1 Tax=Cannabis sativa TaxID=3483 RepID=A0A803QDI3_CANSA